MKYGVAGAESSKPRYAVQKRGFPSFNPGNPTGFLHMLEVPKTSAAVCSSKSAAHLGGSRDQRRSYGLSLVFF
jgi:hypothetical protein